MSKVRLGLDLPYLTDDALIERVFDIGLWTLDIGLWSFFEDTTRALDSLRRD